MEKGLLKITGLKDLRKIGIYLILLFLLVLGWQCEKASLPFYGQGKAVALKAAYTAVTEAWLHLKVNVQKPQANVRFFRNESLLWEQPVGQVDSLIYDSTLAPAHTYRYRAELWENNQYLGSSPTVTLTTLDTTSHDFSWDIYEFGGVHGSSVLYDAAIIDENNIWAVGEIHTAETDTFDSLGNWVNPYNAVHWDGSEWELRRIPFTGWCSAVEFPPLRSIIAFSEDDIWFARGGSLVHYNGSSFYNDCDMNSLLDGSINKIWGSDSNNLYAVGGAGTIVHYDGSRWRRIEVPGISEFILTDIWGVYDQSTGKDRIYVTASSDPFASSPIGRKILRIKGEQIEEVNVDGLPDYLTTIWFKDWHYYVGTLGGVYTSVGLLGQWDWIDTLSYYGIGRVRGNENNDVFVGGAFGLCAHYNGMSWRIYTGRELPWIYGTYTGLDVQGNKVVLVGDRDNDAIIVIGNR